jgi:hypothetical protein
MYLWTSNEYLAFGQLYRDVLPDLQQCLDEKMRVSDGKMRVSELCISCTPFGSSFDGVSPHLLQSSRSRCRGVIGDKQKLHVGRGWMRGTPSLAATNIGDVDAHKQACMGSAWKTMSHTHHTSHDGLPNFTFVSFVTEEVTLVPRAEDFLDTSCKPSCDEQKCLNR